MLTYDGQARQVAAAVGAPNAFAGLIGELVQLDLIAVAPAMVEGLLRAVDFDDSALAPFAYFVPQRYTRTCVYRDDHFELLVLCWSPGAHSPIHDHGASRCFLKVERGSLQVQNYALTSGGNAPGPALLARGEQLIMTSGDVDMRSPKRDVHRVSAAGGPAISLHVYAKPLDECLVFDLPTQSCRSARNRYDTPQAR